MVAMNDKRDKNTSVEVQDVDGHKTHEFLYVAILSWQVKNRVRDFYMINFGSLDSEFQ